MSMKKLADAAAGRLHEKVENMNTIQRPEEVIDACAMAARIQELESALAVILRNSADNYSVAMALL